ncbi:ribose-5-phosphate isomerase RpiA [Novosphingobium sp. 9U]|uniref:ribose-5-phosphate isomerase RpiA n=1 Tax=Novosphingobium sp. 9U TaxID=2653158 RepID=UPI0012F3F058|nr:ribose-5-phosphate isomerase RpiA [Novosphingobium sp. 9U]VWX54529.1 Ribose-5-phosphate isomerase A [Novosphingobium sp. 9U]
MVKQPEFEVQKRAAASAAVAEITDGMLIGLGTGSTAAYAVSEVARRVRDGLAIRAVATSKATAHAAMLAGIEVVELQDFDRIDLAIDGVDEIDGQLRAIKGGGGAMLQEKIVADAADRMIAIADASKRVRQIGARPVPVEVLPMAQALALRRAGELGARAVLRCKEALPFRTDQGNLIIDCHFAVINDPANLADRLARIPGVLGHGLFLSEIDTIYVGVAGGVERCDRP